MHAHAHAHTCMQKYTCTRARSSFPIMVGQWKAFFFLKEWCKVFFLSLGSLKCRTKVVSQPLSIRSRWCSFPRSLPLSPPLSAYLSRPLTRKRDVKAAEGSRLPPSCFWSGGTFERERERAAEWDLLSSQCLTSPFCRPKEESGQTKRDDLT